VEIKHVEQVSNATYLDYKGLKIRKHEGVRKIFGNVTHHIEMDNSYVALIDLFIKQGGEYRLLPYKLKKSPLCDFYRDDTFFYEEMTKMISYPFPFVCPFKTVSLTSKLPKALIYFLINFLGHIRI
jgi:hypothetical protein